MTKFCKARGPVSDDNERMSGHIYYTPATSTRLILDNEYNVKVRSFFIDSKYESITMSSSLWRQNVFATLEFDDSKDALMGEDNETTEVQLLEEKGAWVVEGEEEGEAEQQAPMQIEGAGAVKTGTETAVEMTTDGET